MIGFKALSRDDATDVAIPLIAGYAVVMLIGAAGGLWRRYWRAVFAGILIALVPLAITAALVYFKPKLAGRYGWPAWIGFDVLAGLAITVIPSGKGCPSRIGTRVAVLLILAVPYVAFGPGHPPDSDFCGAFAYLCGHGSYGDLVLLGDGTLFH